MPRATAWEHLQLSARLRRLTDWEPRGRDLLERFELGDAANRVTGGFSHGMGRRLSVLLAALHEPEVLLLDEPFDGVDPIGVEATLDVIADARARGACVLVSTHLRELAIEACGQVLVLRGGSRVATVRRRGDGRRGGRACLPRPPGLTRSGDVGHLLRFRAATVRRRAALGWALLGLVLTTVAVAIVPAFVPGAGDSDRALDVAILLPTGFAGFLALAVVSAVVSGGGRELLPRDQGAPYPISPTTDHLGALLLAPLNIAWLLQAWALLGSAAYGLGPARLVAGSTRRPAVGGGGDRVRAGRRLDAWRRYAGGGTASSSSGC